MLTDGPAHMQDVCDKIEASGKTGNDKTPKYNTNKYHKLSHVTQHIRRSGDTSKWLFNLFLLYLLFDYLSFNDTALAEHFNANFYEAANSGTKRCFARTSKHPGTATAEMV
jgi:hypothetical protein